MYMCRYLSEEVLEVQVWSTLTKSGAQRPLAEDTLLGSAHILLSDVISGDSISGSYLLFKAGVDRLGGQTVHVEVHKTVLHRGRDATPTHEPFDDTGGCIEVLVCMYILYPMRSYICRGEPARCEDEPSTPKPINHPVKKAHPIVTEAYIDLTLYLFSIVCPQSCSKIVPTHYNEWHYSIPSSVCWM